MTLCDLLSHHIVVHHFYILLHRITWNNMEKPSTSHPKWTVRQGAVGRLAPDRVLQTSQRHSWPLTGSWWPTFRKSFHESKYPESCKLMYKTQFHHLPTSSIIFHQYFFGNGLKVDQILDAMPAVYLCVCVAPNYHQVHATMAIFVNTLGLKWYPSSCAPSSVSWSISLYKLQ